MIKTINLIKKYQIGGAIQAIIKGIDFEVARGEFIAIIGRSGAGKSTLLYLLSLLEYPDEGSISIDGQETVALNDSQITDFRLNNFGFVFQEYALLPELNSWENVAIPILMRGYGKKQAYQLAKSALEQVGLGDKLINQPSQLSGGEQQRVSIARAIALKPKILFADEPTANLDSKRACEIFNIFLRLNREGQTIVIVTHEKEFAEMTHRVVELNDGKIISDRRIEPSSTNLCHKYNIE